MRISECFDTGQFSRSGIALNPARPTPLTNHSPTLQVASSILSTGAHFELALCRSGDKVTEEYEEAGAATCLGEGGFQ